MYLPKTKPTTRATVSRRQTVFRHCDLTPSARRRRRKFSRRTRFACQNTRYKQEIIESLHAIIQSQRGLERAHLLTMLMIIVWIFLSPRSEAKLFSPANACTELHGTLLRANEDEKR